MTFRSLAAAALLALGLIPAVPPPPLAAQEAIGEYRGAAALGLALRRLGTTRRVLMVGAHPDDENTAFLAALALEDGADVAYLSLTRGDGGQNGIGPELHEALGLLRSEELLAARRVDGATQFFGREYDFGFSKTADETFRHWPREQALRDAVGVIRLWRPDVIVSVWSGTPRDGHGQHQASGIIALEAFAAAADSTRFPDQIRAGLAPFHAQKLFLSRRGSSDGATVRLAMGGLDPLIGSSPFQLAMASRSRHRSQDMGAPQPAGPRWGYLQQLEPAGSTANASLWAGVDTTVGGRTLSPSRQASEIERVLAGYPARVDSLRASARLLEPGALVGPLSELLILLRRQRFDGRLVDAAATRRMVENEIHDVESALAMASGLVLDATLDRARVVPGGTLEMTLSLWNGGEQPVFVSELTPRLPAGWAAQSTDSTVLVNLLAPGSLAVRRFRVTLPATASPTEPYFLRQPRDGDLYRWGDDWTVNARPFEPAPFRAVARVGVSEAEVPLEREATFREVDPRQGELRRPVLVVPPVSVLLEPVTSILPLGAAARPLRFRARLTAEGPAAVSGQLGMTLPPGWTAAPRGERITLAPGQPRDVELTLTPPAGVRADSFPVSAFFVTEAGDRYSRGLELVDYPHVRARPLYLPAQSTVRAFAVRVPRVRVGYITGAGEAGPAILEQIGITPSVLTADSLAGANLDAYDVIVTGIRAYEVRHDLGASNPRLLEYVRRGGTLIVNYNKYELVTGHFTPFPLTMANPHDRVTDETSPVRILEPAHRLFTTPNRITDADWAGWVQERGLYFAHTWDPQYTPLLELADPGEQPLRGGLLVAHYGQGTYVYTGLAFFRQLPEGVPGAWRLFANLLALGEKTGR
jgi:LmbE family N-acetylglucosaminyl deacetylase